MIFSLQSASGSAHSPLVLLCYSMEATVGPLPTAPGWESLLRHGRRGRPIRWCRTSTGAQTPTGASSPREYLGHEQYRSHTDSISRAGNSAGPAGSLMMDVVFEGGRKRAHLVNLYSLAIRAPARPAILPHMQDADLQCALRRCSHSNLQALREIDARGVSFLRCSSQGGDSRLLVESPDYGLLSADDSQDAATTVCYVPRSRESCQATSAASTGHLRVGTPLSCQMGFFVR